MKKIETRCTVREHPLNQDDKQFYTHDGFEVQIELNTTIVFSLENGKEPVKYVEEQMNRLFYHDELFNITVDFEDIYENHLTEEEEEEEEEQEEKNINGFFDEEDDLPF